MILVKFPTRERPLKFITTLRSYIATQAGEDVKYLFTFDKDDEATLRLIPEIEKICSATFDIRGRSTKVDAINSGMDLVKDWDILLNASDDMIPQKRGWDLQVEKDIKVFPDGDGALWYNDGHQNRICTLVIETRKYYNRFKYIYHSSYKSVWCDNEWTDVAIGLKRLEYSSEVLFRHESPAWKQGATTFITNDFLHKHNESFYHVDKLNYETRKTNGFK